MAVTVVSICNSALIKVGAARISSITQNVKSAELLNAIFEATRDEVLRAHKWNFATKRVTLAPDADEPEFEWDYRYELPSDCLKFLDTYPDDIDHVIEDGFILTDEAEELLCSYIYRHEDPSAWDSLFAEALACKLAEKVGYALTQSSKIVEDMKAAYKAAIKEARTMDGGEGVLKGLTADTWTLARR